MKCLRCGTSISSDQVFCQSCREDMDRHPVKPGTPIVLPNRPERRHSKSGHKKIRKAEEQIANLKAFIFWLMLVIVALITALAITIALLLSNPDQQEAPQANHSITYTIE